MLYRKAYEKLLEWKVQDHKKALCVVGARQIAKTTLIRKFGTDNYKNFVEINFITDHQAGKIFSGSLDADTIITNLTAYIRKPMEPGKTLVLLDEVQECPNVRTAVKFLVEDGRFDYIESGSLLGVKYKEIRSYPVGFEEIYRMYPMDFEEYILANGVQNSTIDYLRHCFETLTPISDSVHLTMIKLFLSYIVVGGMPQVVQTYVDTHDIGRVITNQNDILEQYRLDIAKYAIGNDKIKIKAIFDSIPSQLNAKNRRFILNNIDEKGRQNRYANSFEWLEDAGVGLPCYNVTEPQPPLQLNEKHSLFKLFMNDTGLLCAACMENVQFDILNGNLDINLGSILENVMAQSIKSNGFSLHFFDAKKYGELDFVIQNGMDIDLVEIKSGKDYKKHTALDKILAVDEWNFNRAYVFCKGNIESYDNVVYLPWYQIMFFKPDAIPKGLKYEVDISNLI
ncbi:MAG: ATP-binding protein [Clostridiaceae bacterium]|nr:ATP-binding protein [Clostridiaceae bacterium]